MNIFRKIIGQVLVFIGILFCCLIIGIIVGIPLIMLGEHLYGEPLIDLDGNPFLQ